MWPVSFPGTADWIYPLTEVVTTMITRDQAIVLVAMQICSDPKYPKAHAATGITLERWHAAKNYCVSQGYITSDGFLSLQGLVAAEGCSSFADIPEECDA